MAWASCVGVACVMTSAQPALDARTQRLAADAVAVVQRRQRARVEEGVGQAGELEAGRLHAMAQQRGRHRFAQAAGSKRPVLAAPAGAVSRALLSTPAAAARGKALVPGAALPA